METGNEASGDGLEWRLGMRLVVIDWHIHTITVFSHVCRTTHTVAVTVCLFKLKVTF